MLFRLENIELINKCGTDEISFNKKDGCQKCDVLCDENIIFTSA